MDSPLNSSHAAVPLAVDNLIVGITYMFLSAACFIPYSIILKLMITDIELKENQCYRIMFHMGLADIGQLIGHFCSGPITVCQCVKSTSVFSAILGAIINSSWICVMPLTTLLATNRYIVICRSHLAEHHFSSSRVTLYLCVCWLSGLIYQVGYLSPLVGFVYYESQYSWGYDHSPLSGLVKRIRFVTDCCQMLFNFILYVACVWNIKQMIDKATNAQRRDIRLLLQSVLIFCYNIIAEILWHTDMWMQETKWTLFVINIAWIGQAGIHPVVYLTFNKTLRRELCQTMRGVHPQEPETRA